MADRTGAYRALVDRPERNGPFERLGRRWEDNTKMDLQEVRWEGMDWTDLAQDTERWRGLVNAVMNLRIP
jgi:hypothetical protein